MGRQRPDEQRRRRLAAVVSLVAHAEGLGDHPRHLHPTGPPQRGVDDGRELAVHPCQALEHGGVVGAHPEDLALPHVDRRVGLAAGRPVADDPDGQRGRDDAGHRPHRAMVVTGVEGEPPRLGEPHRVLRRPRPPLEQAGADHGATHRPAHAVPADRRAGVEHDTIAQARHDLTRRRQPDEDGLSRLDAPQRLAVRVADGHLSTNSRSFLATMRPRRTT